MFQENNLWAKVNLNSVQIEKSVKENGLQNDKIG